MEPKHRAVIGDRSVEVWDATLDPSIEQLDPERVAQFTGGQMEMQNPVEKYLYRGQIKSIRLVKEDKNVSLEAEFDWVVQADFNGKLPTSDWRVAEPKPYSTTLLCATASWIDEGYAQERQRLVLNSAVTNELIAMFPPGYSDFYPECLK